MQDTSGPLDVELSGASDRATSAAPMLRAILTPFRRAGWLKETDTPAGMVWLVSPRRGGRWGQPPARLSADFSTGALQWHRFAVDGNLTHTATFSRVDTDTYEAVAAFCRHVIADTAAELAEARR